MVFHDIGGMVQEAFELARHFFRRDWLLGSVPESLEFITSDRPLVVLHHDHTFGDDPYDEDALRAIPLSRYRILVFGDLKLEPDLHDTVFTPEMTLICNAAQVKQADRWVIASAETWLRGATKDVEIFDRAKALKNAGPASMEAVQTEV